jgi:ABC-2 type transport system permease protein
VLAIVVVPIALGVLYSAIYSDEEPRPTAEVVVVGRSADAARVAAELPRDVRRSLDLTVTRQADERRARTAVQDDDVDLAVVVPDGLLAAARAGRAPPLRLLAGPDASPATQAVVELVPATIARLSDRAPAVRTSLQAVESTSPSALDEPGLRRYFVLASIVMVLGFIALLATPIILAEELEKRTIEALLLAARGSEVLSAKALVGLVYSFVATAITVALTGIGIARPGVFVVGVVGTAVALVGLGMVFAYLFRSADKLNTWGWVLLMPFLAPAFLAGASLPGWADALVQLTPTGQGMRTLTDGTLDHDLFGDLGVAVAVFVVWGAGGLLVLARLLQRRGS